MGRVYKIECDDGYFYIGSTTKTLQQRLTRHKQNAKKYPDRKLYSHWKNVTIQLIEECENYLQKEDELIRKESDNPLCLNVSMPIQTYSDRSQSNRRYREKTKEKMAEYQRQYRLMKKATFQDSHTLQTLND